jgi:rSAM/selenodomain-associated transferase 1
MAAAMEATPPRHAMCAIGVMAKAPQPGLAKTRLCPPLRHAEAAELSAAFLRDITENITLAARSVPIHGCVAYAPAGDEAAFAGHLAEGTDLVLADGSPPMPPDVHGLGRCLLHASQVLFTAGFGAVCLLNADSPTLPTACLIRAARALLVPGDRIVLGATDDGGYYLLGMRQPHPRLFVDIAWSTSNVAAVTRARAAELGLDVVTLPMWYDVDDAATLARLVAGADDGYAAPATNAWIERSGLRGRMSFAAQ